MRKLLKNQHGLTLVELIVAISITSLVFIGIITFLITSVNNNYAGQARADLLRQAQISLDTITKDIRLSAKVEEMNVLYDPNSPNAENEFGRGWTSDENTLILSKTSEDVHRNILFQDPNRYVTEKDNFVYFVSDRALYKRIIAADIENNRHATTCPANINQSGCPTDIELVENVDDFSIKYYDGLNNEVSPNEARSVETKLVLSNTKGGRHISAEYSTRTVFRNE